jgi:tetratricopeptide (TPR) repeat protein
MNFRSFYPFTILAFFLGLVLATSPEVFGQPDVPEPHSIYLELNRALYHYYREEYDRALPLFESIARSDGENEDLMFWTGVCAYKTGDFQKGISQFEKLLLRQPDMPRVSLELAMAYFRTGKYESAKTEILRAMKTPVPEDIQREMNLTLRLIEAYENRTTWSLRITQGYKYDTNVFAGPGDEEIDDTLFPVQANAEKEDSVWMTDFQGNIIRDIYGPRGAAGKCGDIGS